MVALDETSARAIANRSPTLRKGLWLGAARELNEGWYFPLETNEMIAGCNGIVVNKRSGKLFHLGSAFPPERDLDLYDRGYQFEGYDLTIVSVRDREETLRVLTQLRPTVVEPEEAHGVVWRIPRALTRAELASGLQQLPWTIIGVSLYSVVEALEGARGAGWFKFELREHVAESAGTRR